MRIIITIALFLLSMLSMAQDLEMAEKMRSEGKIYVVVAVLTVILIGLLIYLINIDKKVGKLEKELKK
ncbi:MAG: CcmD family protein [Bacteroidetes bacterium]|nr:MAG: CcmD family protein [Bacteroidota bacterium]MBL1144735.1 CcmD family protein [Bacteroidota bacterium]NOG57529.1 CcmD family protein [Bacteroidota bacterium]